MIRSVVHQLKSDMILDLTLHTSTAYLLAAPSAPDEARKTAVE
jgi:hypothetical protein